MKQLYFSEVLNKYYDTEAECRSAEEKFKKEQEDVENKNKEIALAKSKEKKELSNKIDEAEKALELAYQNYEDVKNQIMNMYKETGKKAEALREPAIKGIKEAQRNRYKAIAQFNEQFGSYTTTYVGDKALEELNRMNREFNAINNYFNDLFRTSF